MCDRFLASLVEYNVEKHQKNVKKVTDTEKNEMTHSDAITSGECHNSEMPDQNRSKLGVETQK